MTLLALAALTVAFVATWVTMPTTRNEKITRPASFFALGLTRFCSYAQCDPTFALDPHHTVELDALERRVKVIFGGAAAVVVLVGLAFGAGRKRPVS